LSRLPSPAATLGGWASSTAATFVTADQTRPARQASRTRRRLPFGTFTIPTPVPALAYWSFTCEERGDFQYPRDQCPRADVGHVVQGAETPDGDPMACLHP
jgi:hypothetical protein